MVVFSFEFDEISIILIIKRTHVIASSPKVSPMKNAFQLSVPFSLKALKRFQAVANEIPIKADKRARLLWSSIFEFSSR